MIQVAICYAHLANLYIVVVLTVDVLAVAAAQVESFPPVHTLPALKTIAQCCCRSAYTMLSHCKGQILGNLPI